MLASRLISLAALAAAAAAAQGVMPEWEVRKAMDETIARLNRIAPILKQAQPQEWVGKGAPDAYVRQFQASLDQLDYAARGGRRPRGAAQKVTRALETYFRMEAVHAMLYSLCEGVRRYQNPSLADLIVSLVNESVMDRERVRQYMVELAEAREKEFEVADLEAQRCRQNLSRQPAPQAPRRAPEAKPATKAVEK